MKIKMRQRLYKESKIVSVVKTGILSCRSQDCLLVK